MKTVKILKDTSLNFHRLVKAGEALRVTDRHASILIAAGVAEEEGKMEEKVDKQSEEREKKIEKTTRKRGKK